MKLSTKSGAKNPPTPPLAAYTREPIHIKFPSIRGKLEVSQFVVRDWKTSSSTLTAKAPYVRNTSRCKYEKVGSDELLIVSYTRVNDNYVIWNGDT